MRQLQLTHDQISIILNALGIAEKAFTDIHKQTVELANVRNNLSDKEQKQIGKYYHVKACEFADINTSIEQGQFDV